MAGFCGTATSARTRSPRSPSARCGRQSAARPSWPGPCLVRL